MTVIGEYRHATIDRGNQRGRRLPAQTQQDSLVARVRLRPSTRTEVLVSFVHDEVSAPALSTQADRRDWVSVDVNLSPTLFATVQGRYEFSRDARDALAFEVREVGVTAKQRRRLDVHRAFAMVNVAAADGLNVNVVYSFSSHAHTQPLIFETFPSVPEPGFVEELARYQEDVHTASLDLSYAIPPVYVGTRATGTLGKYSLEVDGEDEALAIGQFSADETLQTRFDLYARVFVSDWQFVLEGRRFDLDLTRSVYDTVLPGTIYSLTVSTAVRW
jgi:hypothetical protein